MRRRPLGWGKVVDAVVGETCLLLLPAFGGLCTSLLLAGVASGRQEDGRLYVVMRMKQFVFTFWIDCFYFLFYKPFVNAAF